MKNYIIAEYIKGKRTFSHFFFTWFPLLIVFICIPFSQFMYFDINFLVPLIYNWWPVFFLPISLVVLCYQSIHRENESHTHNYYYILNQNIFWKTKILTICAYSLIANSLIALLTIFVEYVMYVSENVIVLNVISSSLILWISTMFIIPITILLAQLTKPIFAIIFNLFGIITGVFTSVSTFWYINPWGWSLRLIAPIIKTHPNGTLLLENDELSDSLIVYPGVFLASISFIILFITVPIILSRTSGSD